MARFVGLLVLLLMIACGGVSGAAEVRIALVDTQKIMRESKAAKKARDILMKDLDAMRSQYKTEENQARNLEEEIKREGPNMAPEVRQEKTEKLEREVKELGRLKSDLEEDFRKKVAELERRILAEVLKVAKEDLRKEKFTVILEKRYVVAADDAVDITEKIIRLYDSVK